MSGIVKLVHKLDDPDGPFYTIGDVAEKLGKSRDTIRRWIENNDDLIPEPHQMPLGESDYHVWLYTEDDIKRMEEFSKNIKIGRPPKPKPGEK